MSATAYRLTPTQLDRWGSVSRDYQFRAEVEMPIGFYRSSGSVTQQEHQTVRGPFQVRSSHSIPVLREQLESCDPVATGQASPLRRCQTTKKPKSRKSGGPPADESNDLRRLRHKPPARPLRGALE